MYLWNTAGVFSAGRISLALIGRRASGGGSVGCADWLRVDGAVDISPGGFWIDYIRPGLEDGQSIVAAPVTGSLVSSTLFSCRDVICTAGSTLNWTFVVWTGSCRLDIRCCYKRSLRVGPWMRTVSGGGQSCGYHVWG